MHERANLARMVGVHPLRVDSTNRPPSSSWRAAFSAHKCVGFLFALLPVMMNRRSRRAARSFAPRLQQMHEQQHAEQRQQDAGPHLLEGALVAARQSKRVPYATSSNRPVSGASLSA